MIDDEKDFDILNFVLHSFVKTYFGNPFDGFDKDKMLSSLLEFKPKIKINGLINRIMIYENEIGELRMTLKS